MPESTVNVLLVEDDDVDAMLLQRMVDKHGLPVELVRAHDGREALELLRAADGELPQAIVLDLNMPVMNGLEFLQELRSDATFAALQVVILTTSEHERDVQRATELGVEDYFTKEMSSDHMGPFLARLTEVLGPPESS